MVDAAVDGFLGLLPGGVQNFFGVGKGGSGIGRHISGGGIGGSIGEGTGLGGLGKTIATSIKGGFRSVGTALKGIFGGGSSATAAGNLGFKGPAAFATPAAGGSSSFLGMTGMAIPAAILGGTLIGTSVLESRDRKKAKRFYNREFAPNFDPSGVEELANGTFLTALEDVHGELDSIYVAIDTQVMTALEDAGVAAMALNMGFEAGGKEVRRIVGDVDAVRTALDNAKVKGYEFGGSLETAIEKGNGLKVAIEGDSEAIKNALQQATAAGIGGFSNLEVTASGVSATLTGDIAQWRKYLDDVLSAALSVAGGFRDVGSEASGAVSDVMALAKAIASMPSITGTSSGSGDRGGYAYGGISRGPQLAWVSEGPYPVEAHIPMLDGRTIPVRFANQAPAAPAGIDIGPLVTEIRGVRQDLDRVVGRPITRTLGRVQRRAAATARKR
ncbi:MAG: hypothetical protein DWQ08_13595 [Proteobacteria bacterium]|nr:MAG: hypothetical protein DWQ08_13595 [Pseudomonadota bacterium]